MVLGKQVSCPLAKYLIKWLQRQLIGMLVHLDHCHVPMKSSQQWQKHCSQYHQIAAALAPLLPYTAKYSRGKTFAYFAVFKPSANVFPCFSHYLNEFVSERLKSTKVFQRTVNLACNRESFPPRKFCRIR